jgi:hypothetical protein
VVLWAVGLAVAGGVSIGVAVAVGKGVAVAVAVGEAGGGVGVRFGVAVAVGEEGDDVAARWPASRVAAGAATVGAGVDCAAPQATVTPISSAKRPAAAVALMLVTISFPWPSPACKPALLNRIRILSGLRTHCNPLTSN